MTDKELIFYAKKIVELKEWGKEYSIELLSSIFHTDFQDTEQIMEELNKKGIVFDWERAKKLGFNFEGTKKAFFLAKDSVKILADMESNVKKELSKTSVVCYCKEKESLATLFIENLSNDTLELYTITIRADGKLEFEVNPPFERVDVFFGKDNVLKISIPNSGSCAYTFDEARKYYNLLRGCAEINSLIAGSLKNEHS